MPVEVVHFNPSFRGFGVTRRLRPRRPLNNFGDLIGPVLVERIVDHFGLSEPEAERRLLAVGSILKLSRPGDVVWGSGINGRSMSIGAAPDVDVRSVRGPRTRQMLVATGAAVPEVFGDPALLWSYFWPRETYTCPDDPHRRPVGVVPNYHDLPWTTGQNVINPLRSPSAVIRDIACCDLIVGSSLHGIVIAESFGIPARLVRSRSEPAFKYHDYYEGTGRSFFAPADTVEEAVAMGGEPPASFSVEALLEAFPRDIYD